VGGVHVALVAPALNVAAVPDKLPNVYVIVCVKDEDAALTLKVADDPTVIDGTVIEDVLGMFVSASV
jgi:hypothetical protein